MTTALATDTGTVYVLRKRNALRLIRRLALCRYKRRPPAYLPRFAAGLLYAWGSCVIAAARFYPLLRDAGYRGFE
jgi:hypothetical protein